MIWYNNSGDNMYFKILKAEKIPCNPLENESMRSALYEEVQSMHEDVLSEVAVLYTDYSRDLQQCTCAISVVNQADPYAVYRDDAAPYRIFGVKDATSELLTQAWEHIQMMEQNGELTRSYTVDYEVHQLDGTVLIHIAI